MRRRIMILAVAAALGVSAWADRTGKRFAGCVLGDEPRTAKQDSAWVARRVDAWQPTVAERAFDQIGWAKDLREAERLGKQHQRPVFLFTYDGASLSGYRC